MGHFSIFSTALIGVVLGPSVSKVSKRDKVYKADFLARFSFIADLIR